MDQFEAEQARRKIKADFEAMGEEMGLDGRCIADHTETGVTFETPEGYQHHFYFSPTVEDNE